MIARGDPSEPSSQYSQNTTVYGKPDSSQSSGPFYNQYDSIHHPAARYPPAPPYLPIQSQYPQFDMSGLGNALPSIAAQSSSRPYASFEDQMLPMHPPSRIPQSEMYPLQFGAAGQPHMQHMNTTQRSFAQQQQQQHQHSAPMYHQSQSHARPQQYPYLPYPTPLPAAASNAHDMHGRGYNVFLSSTQPSPTTMPQLFLPAMDPRFILAHAASTGQTMPAFATPPHMPIRRPSENGPIPSYPRGPPRKPRQSGHALWVGNLPPGTSILDLKDHFSRNATKDIESLFLISKSNCAFVNYKTESACQAAMNRFHDSRFHGVRLVCRLRRGSTASSQSLTPRVDSFDRSADNSANDNLPDDPIRPSSRALANPLADGIESATVEPDDIPPASAVPGERVPERFFIVKSLTMQDLEASVRDGIWATQSHNEQGLNKAFESAESVYLIFSANKSGEYFGYARMTSKIDSHSVRANPKAGPHKADPTDGPTSNITPATDTAPRGRVIDDSARGTMFWEAEPSVTENEFNGEIASDQSGPMIDHTTASQDWGKPFRIEWMSTGRLPFYRTRGLRNPWNANREVKIARDGTELEPSVGQKLVSMFHRPTGAAPHTAPQLHLSAHMPPPAVAIGTTQGEHSARRPHIDQSQSSMTAGVFQDAIQYNGQ